MQWLPEYGVAFIAMGSRTYTGWGGVANQVFDAEKITPDDLSLDIAEGATVIVDAGAVSTVMVLLIWSWQAPPL